MLAGIYRRSQMTAELIPMITSEINKKGRCPRVLDSSSSSPLVIPMSIIGHAYKLSNSPSTISRHDSRIYNSSHIDGTLDYLSCQAILASVLVEQGESDLLEECYHCDALIGLAIRGRLDRVGRRVRLSNDLSLITS